MNPLKKCRQLFKASKVTVHSDLDDRILHQALPALDRSSSNQPEQTHVWSTIMKYRKVQLVTAVAVLALVGGVLYHFTGSIDGVGPAWAQIVQRVESAHNRIYQQFHTALQANDMEAIAQHADDLSEFWQQLNRLMEMHLEPEQRDYWLVKFEEKKARLASDPDRVGAGIELFIAHSDQFLTWIAAMQDESWLHETMYVSDQLEEYCEEIRDGGRQDRLGMDYITHCLTGFEVYAQWFERLPWNDTTQIRSTETVAAAIMRDLTTAQQELRAMVIADPDRFAQRALSQVAFNIETLQTSNNPTTVQQLRDIVTKSQKVLKKFEGNLRCTITPEMPNSDILALANQQKQQHQTLHEQLLQDLDQAFALCRGL